MSELVSVIIPTVTGDKNLSKCVDAVKASHYKNVEIIVVDEGLERSAQRNIGIKRAKGRFLLILDSDQFVSPELITECEWKIRLCHGIYIPEIITTKGFFGFLRNWERQFYTATPVDCVRFVHANKCPLFDETMSGPEDSDWDRRIGRVRLTARAPLYHQDDVSFMSYLRKKAYYTKSMRRYAEQNPKDKVLNFWYRCFGIFIEKDKWKSFLRNPFLALCIMGLVFIRGIIYLKGIKDV